jgi:hypothetical protein
MLTLFNALPENNTLLSRLSKEDELSASVGNQQNGASGEKPDQDEDCVGKKFPIEGKRPQAPYLQSEISTRLEVLSVLSSNHLQSIKDELLAQLKRYENIKLANAKLLYKLLCCRGNLQVCCRIRPRNDQELATGAKICLEVDENEIACFDRYGGFPTASLILQRRTIFWRTFQFDKVWDEFSSQVLSVEAI